MLDTLDERDRPYRNEIARAPAVRACLDDDAAAALVRRPEKDIVTAQALTIGGGLFGPLMIPLGVFVAFRSHSIDAAYVSVGVGAAAAALLGSAGGIYARGPWPVGLGLHVAGAAAVTWAITHVLVHAEDDTSEHDASSRAVRPAFYGGLLAYAVGTVWDLATEGGAVRAWNRSRLQVAPTFHDGAPGLVLSGRF
jgi:hypothetical protein